MTATEPLEQDAHTQAVEQPDLRVQLDAIRAICPVSETDDGAFLVLGHAETVAAATDADAFSSAVTVRRAIPNTLDGAEHGAYRAIVDSYMTPEKVAEQEPQCREAARAIVAGLPRDAMVRTVLDIGTPYAVHTQCRWLGWAGVEDELVAWMAENRAATRSGDRARTAEVAHRFDAIIRRLLAATPEDGDSVTAQLRRETIDGRPLEETELVSILRNWTAGDLGSLATSIGVIVRHLAADVALQAYLRMLVTAGDAAAFEDAVEEILRIDDPFVSNRRITTRDVTLGGQEIPAGTRVVLNWTAANRDPGVFPDPDAFNPHAHAGHNLVFGIGPHVCPGRALTLMELRVVVWELLVGTQRIVMPLDRMPVRELPPVSGWAQVPIVLDPV